ncbi:MAG: 30S ribosomal protein S16 [Candidatus Omnitrophica bacterium]|nr:30S ribosomal protein S16 [Candidatus Omnitrophota bacterium]
MSVKIRLKKASDRAKKRYHFRIIVCTHTKARDGRSLDELGFYDPSKNPPLIKINREKLDFWLKRGATLSETLKKAIKKVK